MTTLEYAVGGVLGIVVLVVVVLRPRWALFLLVAVVASNASSAIGSVGPLSPYIGALGLATVALGWGVLRGTITPRVSPVVVLLAVAAACTVPAVVAARDSQIAFSFLTDLLKDLWFLNVVVLLAGSVASAWFVARVATGAMVVLSLLTLVDQFVLGNATTFGGFATVSDALGVGAVAQRHSGPFIDPNFFGRVLVLMVPLACALAFEAANRGRRASAVGWLAGAGSLLGAIVLTGSRGAMLSVALAVVVTAALCGPTIRRRALLLLPVGIAVIAVLPGVGSRLASLAQLEEKSTFVEKDYSLVERGAIQKVVLSIFLDNPALGVGPQNTAVVWPEYSINGGAAISRTAAPHNIYFELAAETGIVGFTGWMIFLAGLLVIASRVLVSQPVGPRAPPTVERVLAAAVTGSVLGWCLASVFLHLTFLKSLLLVAAVVACIPLRLEEPTGDDARIGWRPRARPVLVSATVVVVAAGLVAGSFQFLRHRTWVAQVPINLVATSSSDGTIDPYARSVTTRRVVVATYAAVVDRAARPVSRSHPALAVVVVGSGSQAVLTIRVEGTDRAEVRSAAVEAAADGDRLVRSTANLRALAVTDIGTPTTSQSWSWFGF